MYKIHKLPHNYKHPSNMSMGGFWALSEVVDHESRLLTVHESWGGLLDIIKDNFSGINYCCFTVICINQGNMLWALEMSDLSQVASFLVNSEDCRSRYNNECEIHISKNFVLGAGSTVVTEKFKADGAEELMRVALRVST